MAFTVMNMSARMPKAEDVRVTDIRAERDGSRLNISFTLDCSAMPKSRNIETSLTPMLVSGNDSLMLDAVTVAGKARWLQAKRNHSLNLPGNTYYRAGKVTEIPYQKSVAFMPWMENARIDLIVENMGCCRSRKTLADTRIAQLNLGDRAFDVPLQYIVPKGDRAKVRNAKGEAYIDFQVNKTDILPDYRNNPRELAKIRATIDSVKSDPDFKITSVAIKGFASPEGPYANNERLAEGRTEALRNYVQGLYSFPAKIMKTSWVAEDWTGLRKFVANSMMTSKDAILAVIDSDLTPDEKDRKLKVDFPTDYAYMLQNWYPALRHSDYTVEYTVRSYTDPAEIAKVMKKSPSKLSIREFFILAETLNPESSEYANVFETAVRMYPDDPVANLNAANIAISRGNFDEAARFLDKAGNSPQAIYARGVLAAKKGEYDVARRFFNQAQKAGIDTSAAEKALETMQAPVLVTF